ncbi:MAG: O-antigen ligase family protein [Eubacteriales bacterium]|nr:O-antigen ligase family protein [Eubacteriales bacterium]
MRIGRAKLNTLAVFLLLYYIYMNSMRKLMIPFDKITVPLLLAVSFVAVAVSAKGKMYMRGNAEKLQCISWLLICVYIVLNSISIFNSLKTGGLIQLFVSASMLIFMTGNTEWCDKWLCISRYFVMLHTAATIIFSFTPGLYSRFVSFFFADNQYDMMRYYSYGWMSGLSGHFSTNGMILGVGLALWFEQALKLRRNGAALKRTIFAAVCIVLILYALVLSSKRGPLFASLLAIAFTYIFAQGKNVGKRIAILSLLVVVFAALYIILLDKLPGLATIANKIARLENSDAGLLNGRLGLWERALELFRENPFFGAGYGSYAVYADETQAITGSAHNYYLQILAELGILGLVLYLTAFSSGILHALKQLKAARRLGGDSADICVLSSALEIQIFVIIYSLTSTSLMYYTVLIQYFLSCAAVRAMRRKLDARKIEAAE